MTSLHDLNKHLSLCCISAVLIWIVITLFFFFCFTPMHFANVQVCALHHCSKIDFLRLSHRRASAGSRKCLLPWRSMNVIVRQTLPTDTWQRVLLLSGPPWKMCRHVCVSPRLCKFSCPLNVSLPPTVCLLPDGWMVCTGGSWKISFRGLMKHSHWTGQPIQIFKNFFTKYK